MKSWRLLPLVSAPMPYQMALDEILFRQMEKQTSPGLVPEGEGRLTFGEGRKFPLLRFYFASEPFVTLGYFSKEKEPGACRRLTGGGRVIHGKDLIFSLIAHKSADESFSSVVESYHKIHCAIRGAFEQLGRKAEFYEACENLPKGGDCFVYPIVSDLKIEDKKIAGGAQKRSSGVLLHHESILVPEGLTPLEIYSAAVKSFEKEYDIKIETTCWSPGVLAAAKKLSADGYEPGKLSPFYTQVLFTEGSALDSKTKTDSSLRPE